MVISINKTIISIMLKAHTYALPKARGVKRIRKMSPNLIVLSKVDLNYRGGIIVDWKIDFGYDLRFECSSSITCCHPYS